MEVAAGFKPRIGRAVMVLVGGGADAPVFVERREVPLLPRGDFAPYHVASELPPARRQESVDRALAHARSMAEGALREAIGRCKAAGHELVGCGILVGKALPAWSTEDIVAVHVRMHMAEGEMFRAVLIDGAGACGLPAVTLPDKAALEEASRALAIKPAQFDRTLDALGKQAGAPWRKEQREAAAAALVALARRSG